VATKNNTDNLISLLPTILSISSVLFMVGLLGLVLIASKKQTDIIKENFEIRVLLVDTAKAEDGERLQKFWTNVQGVKDVQFIDKSIAAKSFEKEIGQEFTKILDINPIPHALIIRLNAGFSEQINLADFETELKKESLVENVDYQTDLLANINKNVKLLVMILTAVSFLFALISIALINSTIRLSLFARRFIIKSMQYVGATDWFIMKPFIKQFLFYGFFSAIIAIACLGAIYFGLQNTSLGIAVDIEELINIKVFAAVSLILLGLGTFLVLFSTIFAVKRYLRLQNDQLN